MTAMPIAPANADGIELCYETFGDPDGVPLLLIMGLGGQLVRWDPELVEGFVDRGFYAIRFDNRDVGLSTKPAVGSFDIGSRLLAAFGGQPVEAPYLLSDMAADAVGLLDHLDIPAAHVVGVSMGGMIAQTMAIEHPGRLLSLTSIMSTTGDLDVGQPTPEAAMLLLRPRATDRAGAVAADIEVSRIIGSPEHFDPERVRRDAELSYDRCFHPAGIGHQLLAIMASGSRSAALADVDVPTLVLHGDVDPLVDVSGGRRTAEAIPGAELVVIEGMGHDLPPVFWPTLIERITALAARADIAAA